MEMPKLTLSSSPHIQTNENVNTVMRDVIIALLPATIAAIYYFRFGAIVNILVAVLGAVAAEYLIQKLMKKPITIKDYSAAVTGLLLAFNVPSTLPWWMTLIGAVFAIAVVKQLFGGLGHNFMNPALAARAVLLASWPVEMTSWVTTGTDAVATATPLAVIKGAEAGAASASMFDLLIGNVGGCIGETSAILLIIGGIYLIYRGVITYVIPTYYIGTVAVLTFIFSGFDISMLSYNILAGGLILGAFFMATDYTTSPVSKKGQIIYAIGCGLLTAVIRYYGGYPEGVSYSILLMNVATPLIDKYISPRVFGEVAK
ncbi:putative inner membrane oxidoreductase [Acetoanaerobium sticklandii]|uniref:Ion-translocating oxidoreductase complex subunit D n=1 Tax=Acetoanaerobium sticklandii (strain ATCC 12662 / DSM 519 / JCM 1433 / CCUG 9281 / NCIMB 10654 / HF) TaxID=499177 RepID=E3PRL7_ACESD|nr:RnfABCDGE type electron transport complex subunit D [Acetoanaerobium sticklandii]CBH21521.1 putative inner membrane oxidoreductase [Acetoanaerobium sticklandii]